MTFQTIVAATGADVRINENFDSVAPAGTYGRRAPGVSGLTWAYYGGRGFGNTIADGTVTLTSNATNYLVADRSTGAVSVSTITTNWDDSNGYLRLYLIVAGAATITSATDYREFIGGDSATSVSLADVNVWTKNQSVADVSLTDGTSIATNAALSNNFTVTLGGNRTLASPTNMSSGMVLNWTIKQDATGGRTLVYGSKFKWPGGSTPTLSTGASAIDLISAKYDSGADVLLASMSKGFA